MFFLKYVFQMGGGGLRPALLNSFVCTTFQSPRLSWVRATSRGLSEGLPSGVFHLIIQPKSHALCLAMHLACWNILWLFQRMFFSRTFGNCFSDGRSGSENGRCSKLCTNVCKCKPNKPFPPQLAFSHGVLTRTMCHLISLKPSGQ